MKKNIHPVYLYGTAIIACGLWFVTFYMAWSIFWIKISLSATLLAVISMVIQRGFGQLLQFDKKSVVIGVVSAIVLYGIFWAGKAISTSVFPFAENQIAGVYVKGEGTPLWIIFFLLFFITGPAEEIYWRGFLQKGLMARYGDRKGWIIATGIYAGVHVWSFNFMLIGAAAVAGAFWGYIYMKTKDLSCVIVSHSFWSAFIFTVFPVP
jgi:hypothetical protein